jgi:hypothetical protein
MVTQWDVIVIGAGQTGGPLSARLDLSERHASRGAALGLYSFVLAAGQLAGNVLGGPFAARWQMDGVLMPTRIRDAAARVEATGFHNRGVASHQPTAYRAAGKH